MKKVILLLSVLFLSSLILSCADMSETGRNIDTMQTGEITFGIFCDVLPINLNWNVDCKMDIWYDNGGGMLVNEDFMTAGEGAKSWKFTGTGSWMGVGVRVEPLTSYKNMSSFNGGRLHFMYKGTKVFKVGIKSGASQESWIFPSQLFSYGLKTNDSWCDVNIPMSAFQYFNSNLDLSNISQYFMWASDSGYTVGDIYHIDGVYWAKTYQGNGVDTSMPTNFGLYSDSVAIGVLWDNNCKLDIWSTYGANMELTNIQAGTGEGLNCWKLTGTGLWMGLGIRVNPETNYVNMSEYALGTLKFMAMGTNSFKVGIKSGSAGEGWITPSQLSNYGYIPDGSWRTVVIPMSSFSGVDFTHISEYFMFVSDVPLGYQNGIVFYLDNVYWSKKSN